MSQKVILNLHIYGGLLCFSYLIIFGISSLNFNHPYEFTRQKSAPTKWEQAINLNDLPCITNGMTNEQRIAAKGEANHIVRRELGLFGHQRPWAESWWDQNDPSHYHASLVRPGVEYDVDVHLDQKLAKVTETRANPFVVIRGLHGLHGELPGSTFVSTWSWYTEICVIVVIFAGITGIYLWTRRRNERRIGFALVGSAAAFSLALMFYLTLHG